jgi:hypothetical protein
VHAERLSGFAGEGDAERASDPFDRELHHTGPPARHHTPAMAHCAVRQNAAPRTAPAARNRRISLERRILRCVVPREGLEGGA